MVRRCRKREPQPMADPCSVLMRVRECGSVEEVLLVTDVQGLLGIAGPARFQRAASHREKRSSEAGVGWRGDGGEDQKAL